MKITFDIDCTPQEARALLGLPDLEPLQQQLVNELQRQLDRNLSLMDPETLIKTWLPTTLQGFDDIRNLFGGVLGRTSARASTASSDDPPSRKGKAKKRKTRRSASS